MIVRPPFPDEPGEPVRPRTVRLLAVLVVLAGLGLASWIWRRALEPSESSGYQVIDGVAYPLSVEDTKAYTRQMERYGGKALVVIEAFWRGFDALGRSRWAAAVIAVVAGALGLRLWRAARSGTG